MALTTPNLSLVLPAHGDANWDTSLVNAFEAIDTAWGILTLPWSSITGLPTSFPSDWNTLVNKPTIPTPVALKVNGTANASQSTLNLKAGANVTLADDGVGGVTITSAAAGGSVVWGAITGTLSTQTDLQTALNAKAATGANTDITSVTLGAGTSVSPALTIGTGLSIYQNAPNGLVIRAGGANKLYLGTAGDLALTSGNILRWSSTGDATAAADTALTRTAPGVMALGNGTPSDTSGTLNAANHNVAAVGVATSGANFGSGTLKLLSSYWTGTAAAQDSWFFQAGAAAGTNPSVNISLQHSGTPTSSVFAIYSNTQVVTPTIANSGANANSTTVQLTARYWDGTTSQQDSWSMQNVLGSGANPSTTLSFTHGGSGSPGTAMVSMPVVKAQTVIEGLTTITGFTYTATTADTNIIVTSNSCTVLLPAVASGKAYRIKVTGASPVVQVTYTPGTIDGQGSFYLRSQYQSVDLVSDGTNYYIF